MVFKNNQTLNASKYFESLKPLTCKNTIYNDNASDNLIPEFVADVSRIFEAKDVDEPHDDDGVKVEKEFGGERATENSLKETNRCRKRSNHDVDDVRNLKHNSTQDDGPACGGNEHV